MAGFCIFHKDDPLALHTVKLKTGFTNMTKSGTLEGIVLNHTTVWLRINSTSLIGVRRVNRTDFESSVNNLMITPQSALIQYYIIQFTFLGIQFIIR